MDDDQPAPTVSRRRSYAEEQERRRRAADLFQQGCTRAEVARALGVSRMAATRWYRLWKRGGGPALLGPGHAGRKPRITDEELKGLGAILLAGPAARGFEPDHWTLEQIAAVIEREYGVAYHPSQVRKVLNSLGWFHTPRGRPRRGARTGTGPFAWRRYRKRRRPGKRGYKRSDG